MRIAVGLTAAALLAGCAELDMTIYPEALTYDNLAGETRRAFAQAYQDLPFDEGAVSVVLADHGDLHTYTLVPCGAGRICGGTARGRAGHLTQQRDYDVVQGAYRNVTFYLSPGGDGYALSYGRFVPLAWN